LIDRVEFNKEINAVAILDLISTGCLGRHLDLASLHHWQTGFSNQSPCWWYKQTISNSIPMLVVQTAAIQFNPHAHGTNRHFSIQPSRWWYNPGVGNLWLAN